jgi:hypothetical protein
MFCCIIKINILDDLPQQNKVGECKKSCLISQKKLFKCQKNMLVTIKADFF